MVFLKHPFVCLFMEVLGLHCCVAFPTPGEWALVLVVLLGLLIAVVSLAVEQRPWVGGLPWFRQVLSRGSSQALERCAVM